MISLKKYTKHITIFFFKKNKKKEKRKRKRGNRHKIKKNIQGIIKKRFTNKKNI